jgi:hypothetical protein
MSTVAFVGALVFETSATMPSANSEKTTIADPR